VRQYHTQHDAASTTAACSCCLGTLYKALATTHQTASRMQLRQRQVRVPGVSCCCCWWCGASGLLCAQQQHKCDCKQGQQASTHSRQQQHQHRTGTERAADSVEAAHIRNVRTKRENTKPTTVLLGVLRCTLPVVLLSVRLASVIHKQGSPTRWLTAVHTMHLRTAAAAAAAAAAVYLTSCLPCCCHLGWCKRGS
jgi:hypothetical protein